jgi:hypothetical protein
VTFPIVAPCVEIVAIKKLDAPHQKVCSFGCLEFFSLLLFCRSSQFLPILSVRFKGMILSIACGDMVSYWLAYHFSD